MAKVATELQQWQGQDRAYNRPPETAPKVAQHSSRNRIMIVSKNTMVREIGRRTRLKNRDVQLMLEALVEVWTKELVDGGRIELENFLVLEVRRIDRGEKVGTLLTGGKLHRAPRLSGN